MSIFEYPYVIITILATMILVLGLVGLYFMMKFVKTANGAPIRGFCGLGKIESNFNKAGASREKRCVVYISLSLDSVKRLYSETRTAAMYGQIKEILLKVFSDRIGGAIALYDNENFIALNELDEDEIARCIDNCYKEINEAFVKCSVVGVARIYFGYYLTCSNDVSFETVLSRAKQACSMAQDKNELHCLWDNFHGKEFAKKISIENNIQNEIDNNHFFLEYQPLIDARSGKILGAEVLSRLNSPSEGLLTPKSFLSAVNNVGLNQKFDYYIFEKNCKWISNDANRMNYVYTINFSRNTISAPDFADKIIHIMDVYGIHYPCIAIEILEDKSLNVEEKATMVKNLSVLKGKGVLILLDDFGKGYTAFGDLTEFDISIVKVDKSITQNAVVPTGFVVLKNIIRTAKDLGMKTLCEGVETEEHRRAAIAAGCDMIQGYYYYRPMPVVKLEGLLESQKNEA